MNWRDRLLPRFWSIKDKEYIYWDCYMQTAFNRLIEPNTYGLMYNLYKDSVNYVSEMPTGLRDKNGKLIYEGDIVISESYPFKSDNEYHYAAEVLWSDENACFYYYTFRTSPKVAGRSTGNTGELSEYQWEVIGNIHENPELLGEDR